MTRRTRNRNDHPMVHIGAPLSAERKRQLEIAGLEPIQPGRVRYEPISMFGTCQSCDTATLGEPFCEACQAIEQARIDRWNGR